MFASFCKQSPSRLKALDFTLISRSQDTKGFLSACSQLEIPAHAAGEKLAEELDNSHCIAQGIFHEVHC